MHAIERVVAQGYCTGCGLCAGHFGQQKIRMSINAGGYLRPVIIDRIDEANSAEFKAICPGINLQLDSSGSNTHLIWGPIRSCHTGWASDPEIRHRASSGGGISAILLALLESNTVDFVVHTAADPEHPFRNTVQISTTRDEILAGAGSRYAPSSPLATLAQLLARPGKFAFVGKPCDAAALRNYLKVYPEHAPRVVAILSFMCAGIPSEKGSEEIVKTMGSDPGQVVRFIYRGNGWPGKATATLRDGEQREMDYATSWGSILNRYLQFRCKICPDGTGEFADIVCADAWYGKDGYPDFEEKAGRSLVLARTKKGQTMIDLAICHGHLRTEKLDVAEIARMQPYQESRKRLLVSRLLAVILRRRNIPSYRGLRLLRAATGLGPVDHTRNLLGTLKRIPSTGANS